MAELKLTKAITGWFDVRVYNERIARENRQFKGENDNITFSTSFAVGDPESVAFATHGKPYADANGNHRLRVNFKIRRTCRWFDENAQPVNKPANADLDGKQFECVIQYNEVEGDPNNTLSPRGYWVNAIQFREVVTNPFAAMPGAAPVPPQPQPVQPMPQPQPVQYQQQRQPSGNIGFPPPPPDDLFAPHAGNVGAPMPPMYTDNLPY